MRLWGRAISSIEKEIADVAQLEEPCPCSAEVVCSSHTVGL